MVVLSEEHKKKISNSLKGRKLSNETKKKISESMKGKNKGAVHSIETRKKMSESQKGKKLSDKTKNKISLKIKGHNRKHYEETKRKISKSLKNNNHPNWKGGYDNNIPLYDTYANQIYWCEKVRRCIDDEKILEVKCAYCGKWYIPKRSEIITRIRALSNKIDGEYRLYCSSNCKQECPIYRQIKYPKGYKKTSSREVQPELRQMVFERDNWTCQKCKSKKSLHCHHIEGIRWEPLESCDIDKCITYCKSCHKEVHKIEECGYQDMKCL